jgi:hypothetical protein
MFRKFLDEKDKVMPFMIGRLLLGLRLSGAISNHLKQFGFLTVNRLDKSIFLLFSVPPSICILPWHTWKREFSNKHARLIYH